MFGRVWGPISVAGRLQCIFVKKHHLHCLCWFNIDSNHLWILPFSESFIIHGTGRAIFCQLTDAFDKYFYLKFYPELWLKSTILQHAFIASIRFCRVWIDMNIEQAFRTIYHNPQMYMHVRPSSTLPIIVRRLTKIRIMRKISCIFSLNAQTFHPESKMHLSISYTLNFWLDFQPVYAFHMRPNIQCS